MVIILCSDTFDWISRLLPSDSDLGTEANRLLTLIEIKIILLSYEKFLILPAKFNVLITACLGLKFVSSLNTVYKKFLTMEIGVSVKVTTRRKVIPTLLIFGSSYKQGTLGLLDSNRNMELLTAWIFQVGIETFHMIIV